MPDPNWSGLSIVRKQTQNCWKNDRSSGEVATWLGVVLEGAGCLRVRIPLSAHFADTRLGRQPADHFGLEPEMLWVRIPPEPLRHRKFDPASVLRHQRKLNFLPEAQSGECRSSQSSPECSPPCQGGDRGFKSHRGRFQKQEAEDRRLEEESRRFALPAIPPVSSLKPLA